MSLGAAPYTAASNDKDWFNVQANVRKAIEQLSSIVNTQQWQIKELQMALEEKDQVKLQVDRKADSSALEQLTRRVQALTDTTHGLNDKQTTIGARLTTVERRVNFEFSASAVPARLATPPPSPWSAANHRRPGPDTPHTPLLNSEQPIFGGVTLRSGGGENAAHVSEVSMSERLAKSERKLERLCTACMAMEEEYAATAAKVDTLQEEFTQYADELSTSFASQAALKDAEHRTASRIAAVTGSLEERLADATATVSKASIEQGQHRFDAMRDRVSVELESLKRELEHVAKDNVHMAKLQERVCKVESTADNLTLAVTMLDKEKASNSLVNADRAKMEASAVSLREAVDSVQRTALARIADVVETRDTSSKVLKDLVGKLSNHVTELCDRVSSAEEGAKAAVRCAHEASATTAVASEATKANQEAVAELGQQVRTVQRALFGTTNTASDDKDPGSRAAAAFLNAAVSGLHLSATGNAMAATMPLAIRVAELTAAIEKKADAANLESLRQLDVQSHKRLDALSADVERMCLNFSSNDASALPQAARQAITACVSSVRMDVGQMVEDLSRRLSKLESMPGKGAACNTTGTEGPTMRGPALKRLFECEVENFEERFTDRVNDKVRSVEDAVSKLSLRLTQELTGAHAMITNGLEESSAAVGSLRNDTAQQLDTAASEAKVAVDQVQNIVGELNAELEQANMTLKECITEDEARSMAQDTVSTMLQRDAAQREQRELLRFQVWLEKIGESLEDKVSSATLQAHLDELQTAVLQQLDSTARECNLHADDVATGVIGKLLEAEAKRDAAQQALTTRVNVCEDASAQSLSPLEMKEIREVLVTKADRHETFAKLASLQAALLAKADVADVDQALARKLDIRTFLASQATDSNASAVAHMIGSMGSRAEERPQAERSGGAPQHLGLLTPHATPTANDSGSRGQERPWIYSTPQMSSPVSAEGISAQAMHHGAGAGLEPAGTLNGQRSSVYSHSVKDAARKF